VEQQRSPRPRKSKKAAISRPPRRADSLLSRHLRTRAVEHIRRAPSASDWRGPFSQPSVPRKHYPPMPLTNLYPGDEVAIMPRGSAWPIDVAELACVRHVDEEYLQLADGRMYFLHDGSGLTPNSFGVVVPATDEHRSVVVRRG
jgi:hypothetical protein